MRWLLGLDLCPHSDGALRFARWLFHNAHHHRFFAVHVLELSMFGGAFNPEALTTLARAELNRTIERADAESALAGVTVESQPSAEAGLERAFAEHSAEGVLIGRRALAGEPRLIALGRVARRLIRSVAHPTVVVPPDLELARLERGPILLSTDLGPSSTPALRFAQKLAAELDRELVIVHVLRVQGSLAGLVSADAWDRAQLEHRARAEAELHAWARARAVEGAALRLVEGPVSPELLTVARELEACMIVCGSRRLSLADRLFRSSVGTELAAVAPVPVAIIPHDHADSAAEGIPAFS